jgi:predicted nucleotidyltransferase
MNLINQYTNEIKTLCIQHKVKKLYAFGSVVNGNFNRDNILI